MPLSDQQVRFFDTFGYLGLLFQLRLLDLHFCGLVLHQLRLHLELERLQAELFAGHGHRGPV